jgi:hypothetical protein
VVFGRITPLRRYRLLATVSVDARRPCPDPKIASCAAEGQMTRRRRQAGKPGMKQPQLRLRPMSLAGCEAAEARCPASRPTREASCDHHIAPAAPVTGGPRRWQVDCPVRTRLTVAFCRCLPGRAVRRRGGDARVAGSQCRPAQIDAQQVAESFAEAITHRDDGQPAPYEQPAAVRTI